MGDSGCLAVRSPRGVEWPKRSRPLHIVRLALLVASPGLVQGETVVDPRLHHLRSGETREWSDFPEHAEGRELRIELPPSTSRTFRLRHQDVKGIWKLFVAGKEIGTLPRDGNDMVTFFELTDGLVRDGATLVVEPGKEVGPSDDIYIGDVRFEVLLPKEHLLQSKIRVEMTEDRARIPCRLTITDANGSLHPVAALDIERFAVRTGIVYGGDGDFELGLPPGRYRIYATRGFEYGVDSAEVVVEAGTSITVQLRIREEVPTPGLASCDPHIHTLTHSGHGDASARERVLTIAGEGLDVAVLTEHNAHIDLEPLAQSLDLRRWFTPIVGNEYTTRHGHFSIFPVDAGAEPPDPRLERWDAIFPAIAKSGAVAVILNHPRDIHAGYRPFGAEHHAASIGKNLDGEHLAANALELVNSGALQSDPLVVYRDWFGLLNAGLRISPIGSSDSHDVARYFVGQARTYFEHDERAATIDPGAAAMSIAEGRVSVSLGLLAMLSVAGRGPGELVRADGDLDVDARVLGPSWTKADRVTLYANGTAIREVTIDGSLSPATAPGEKWRGSYRIEKPTHDVHIVLVALGPGPDVPFYPLVRPYQPVSPLWKPYVLGSSGAVFIDADGDGRFTSAREYAQRIVDAVKNLGADAALDAVIEKLAPFDDAVAAQAADLLSARGKKFESEAATRAIQRAPPAVRRGFEVFLD
jgi:hypothetical protein